MFEQNFAASGAIAEKRPENSAEQIKLMEIEWKLEDDDGIVSFEVDPKTQLIRYKTFNGKMKENGEYYEEKKWDTRQGRIKFTEEQKKSVEDDFVNKYGDMSALLLSLFAEITNYQNAESNTEKLIILFLGSAKIVEGESFLLVDMGVTMILNKSTKEVISLDDKKALYSPEAMVEWKKDESVAISWGGKEGIKIFDVNTGKLINKLDSDSTVGLMESCDKNEIVSWSQGKDKKIKFWDSSNSKMIREIDLPGDFPVKGNVLEIMDGKFFVFSDGVETLVLDRNTGIVVKKFPGSEPQEDFRNGISILGNNSINFWRFGGARGKKPVEIIIRGKREINEWERFCEFKKEGFSLEAGENLPDVFWFQCSNLEAKRFEEKEQFKWGEERIYFHVKGHDLVKLSELVKNVAGQCGIAISFKYYDVEKNGQPENGYTRFVANFASVGDAKKLYEGLIGSEEYNTMVADEQADYLGYQLDEKAHYASGYREIRGNDLENMKNKIGDLIQNLDGTYAIKTEEGNCKQLTASEYEEIIKGIDFSAKFKKKWDEWISSSINMKTKDYSIKRNILRGMAS